MFGDITNETVRDTEDRRYGDVDMGGWTIYAQRFSAPIREGFHYFGSFEEETYSGPCNSAEDVWTEILEIRAEIRPNGLAALDPRGNALELERASIIALARRLSNPGEFDAETSYNGPGRFEGADDRALVVSLDILSSHGYADDQAGSTEYGLYLERFGRHVLAHDDRGFVVAYRMDTEELAQAELDAEDARQNPICEKCGESHDEMNPTCAS
jgi:hypothetical protein